MTEWLTLVFGNALDIKEKWEIEMNVLIQDETWEMCVKMGIK